MRFIDRYQAGECEVVWRELVSLGEISDAEVLADAGEVAAETMRRVSRNLDILITRLQENGFRFGEYSGGRRATNGEPVRNPPTAGVLDRIAWLETNCGALPLSLKAWFECVGEVNLVGWNPKWFKIELPRKGGNWLKYVSLEVGQLFSRRPVIRPYFEVDELDPLLLPGLDDAHVRYWMEAYAEWNDEYADERPPFELDLCPDHYMKDDTSGGSYNMTTGTVLADGTFIGEWRDVTFVEYLRVTIRCAGMGGLERFELPPPMKKKIAELTEGLEAF